MVSMATQNANLKNEGVPTKYSYLSSNSSYNTKLGTKLILDISVLFYGLICKHSICIFININENFKNERKIVEKLRGIPTKLPISHLLCV